MAMKSMSMRNQQVTARCDVSPQIWGTSGRQPIMQGDRLIVRRSFWYNGEGWYEFTDDRCAPEVLFD